MAEYKATCRQCGGRFKRKSMELVEVELDTLTGRKSARRKQKTIMCRLCAMKHKPNQAPEIPTHTSKQSLPGVIVPKGD